jgi:hypothetical protein
MPSKPLTPPPIDSRTKHFKQKITQQKAAPLGTSPKPTTPAPKIIDPLKGSK